MTRWQPHVVTFVAVLCVFAVLAARLLLADAQVDWDEELYFQIARHWSGDFLPYRDLFDHKQPFLYLYVKVLSGWGHSMAALRIVQTAILLASIIKLVTALRGRADMLLIPFLFGVLSLPPVLGVNAEIIYIPMTLNMLAFALGGRFWMAALFAALAVSVKVTAVLDVLGAFLFFLAIRKPGRLPGLPLLGGVGIFLAIQLGLYVYFQQNGVDLLHDVVVRNIEHARLRSSFFLPRLFLAAVLLVVGIIVLRLVTAGRFIAWVPMLALGAWTLLSFLQAMATGQYYFHYFVPVLVPLAILAFWGTPAFPVRFVRGLVGSVVAVMSFGTLALATARHEADLTRRSVLAAVCTEEPFHYHGDFLAIYRVCNQPAPLRFMYPRFYTTPHFIEVSGSGGRRWACSIDRPVIVETDGEITTFQSGRDWCERGKVVPVTGVNSSPLKDVLHMIRNGEARG